MAESNPALTISPSRPTFTAVAYQALTITKQGSYIRVNAELKSQPGLPLAPDDAMDDISQKNIKRLKELGDF